MTHASLDGRDARGDLGAGNIGGDFFRVTVGLEMATWLGGWLAALCCAGCELALASLAGWPA